MDVQDDSMSPLDRLHAFLTDKLGISPKVADPFLAGIVGLLATSLIRWGATDELVFDLVQLKILGVVFALGLLGFAAPVAAGLKFGSPRATSRHLRPPPERRRSRP